MDPGTPRGEDRFWASRRRVNYVLDTTFVIDYLRGEPAAIARFDQFFSAGDRVFVNEIVVCEASTGARSHPDPDLVSMLRPLEFVQPPAEAAMLAGRWRRQSLSMGGQLSLADALIAAAAAASDAVVLTRNVRDFSLTPARVETY